MHKLKGTARFSVPLISLIILTITFSFQSVVYAATPKKKLLNIQRELKKKKRRVQETKEREKSVLTKLQTIEKRINSKTKELKLIDKKISGIKLKARRLSTEIDEVKARLAKKETHLKKRLIALYKQKYGGNELLLITAKDYQDLIRRSRYISLLAHHDTRTIEGFRKQINDINFKKKNLSIIHTKLNSEKTSAKKKQQELKVSSLKKNRLLATIRSKRSSYEKTIKELEASSIKIREVIRKAKKKKVPKRVTGRGFRTLRGRLPWPVEGKVLIPFGKYRDPKFNIEVFKNGIEIKAKRGSRPKAIAGGNVVYADWFKGYGLLLIINHGRGYHSLYGNMTEIFHKTGDIIKKGTVLGKTGESRLLNVPSLYFEIRYKGKPINPLRWLKRKTRRPKRK